MSYSDASAIMPLASDGEQAAHAAIQNLKRETTQYKSIYDIAQHNNTSSWNKIVNRSRLTLEQSVNHMQTITGVPDTMKDSMNVVVLAAQNMLKNFPPFDSDSGEEDNDRLPSDNFSASPQLSGDGNSPFLGQSHSDEIAVDNIPNDNDENYLSSEDTVDIPHNSLPTQNCCLSQQQSREAGIADSDTA